MSDEPVSIVETTDGVDEAHVARHDVRAFRRDQAALERAVEGEDEPGDETSPGDSRV